MCLILAYYLVSCFFFFFLKDVLKYNYISKTWDFKKIYIIASKS